MVVPVDYRQEYVDAVDGYLTARRNGNAAACALFFDELKKAGRAAHEAGFREQMEEIWLLPPKLGCSDVQFDWKTMRHLLHGAPNPGPLGRTPMP